MKKIFCLLMAIVMVLGTACVLSGCAGNKDQITLYVYNWGQYIADGEDDSLDVIAAFEEKYPNIKVKYSTFDTNEAMYSKLKTGGITVDVIFPSDYMIARMINEGMLEKLNFDNIPNYKYIDEGYRGLSYDPKDEYSVPYTWGTVGIIYNTKFVAEEDVTGWELLWNEKYKGKILMFDNSRDAFGIAQYILGKDVNTTNKDELKECADLLKKQQQSGVVQQYVMDQVFASMENEEAWIAPYYAGDYLTMVEENEDLAFYLPTEQGFNLFVDAMCIPTCSQQKEAAELFINFLCEPEICGQNMEYLGYSAPETAAKEFMDPEMANNPVAYPSTETLKHGSAFAFLPEEITRYMESLFMEIRNS